MPATTYTPWYKYWIANPIIQLEWVFEDGGHQNLTDENDKPGLFWLERRRGNSGELIGFSVQGDLRQAWAGVTLAPMGTRPLELAGVRLPMFSPEVKFKYSDALAPFIDEVGKSRHTDLERLEGYFPVTSRESGKLNIDLVRIFRFPGIIEGNGGESLDLAIVLLSLLDPNGSLRQNGGGTGPPKKP